jgi:hypothetical protein
METRPPAPPRAEADRGFRLLGPSRSQGEPSSPNCRWAGLQQTGWELSFAERQATGESGKDRSKAWMVATVRVTSRLPGLESGASDGWAVRTVEQPAIRQPVPRVVVLPGRGTHRRRT